MLVITAVLQLIICREGLKILSYQGPEYKEKKLQIGIYIVLKNYKYSKSLFLNTLRCNHLPIKTNENKIMSSLILGWLGFFFFFFKLEHSH